LPSHFWLPLLASCFCPFVSSAFSFASSSFQIDEEKEKHKEKKNHRKKKKCRGGRELTFLLWDETFLLLFPFHILSMSSFSPSSSLVFHISSKLYATQAQELSPVLEME